MSRLLWGLGVWGSGFRGFAFEPGGAFRIEGLGPISVRARYVASEYYHVSRILIITISTVYHPNHIPNSNASLQNPESPPPRPPPPKKKKKTP